MDDSIHNSEIIGFQLKMVFVVIVLMRLKDIIRTLFKFLILECLVGVLVESDYLSHGVYVNKFQIVYDLLIRGPSDLTLRNVSVNTDFIVPINSEL